MTVEKLRPTVFRVTLHAYELSALVAGARWAVEEGEVPTAAREQLEAVLSTYEDEVQRLEAPRVETE